MTIKNGEATPTGTTWLGFVSELFETATKGRFFAFSFCFAHDNPVDSRTQPSQESPQALLETTTTLRSKPASLLKLDWGRQKKVFCTSELGALSWRRWCGRQDGWCLVRDLRDGAADRPRSYVELLCLTFTRLMAPRLAPLQAGTCLFSMALSALLHRITIRALLPHSSTCPTCHSGNWLDETQLLPWNACA